MVDIERIEKRTVQYFYSDGLTEIATGLIFLLLGGYIFGQTIIPEGSPLIDICINNAIYFGYPKEDAHETERICRFA